MANENELRSRYTPENIFQGKRIFGLFKPRNFSEGCVGFFIVLLIISKIPFVDTVRWIVTICVGVTVLILLSIGIKDQSITEFIKNSHEIKKYKKPYHYRRITSVTGNPEPVVKNGKVSTISKSKNFAKKFFQGRNS